MKEQGIMEALDQLTLALDLSNPGTALLRGGKSRESIAPCTKRLNSERAIFSHTVVARQIPFQQS